MSVKRKIYRDGVLIVEDIAGLKTSLSVEVLIEEHNSINHNHNDNNGNYGLIIILLIIFSLLIIGIIFGYVHFQRKKSINEIELPIPFKKAPAIDSLSVSNSKLLNDSDDAEIHNKLLNPKEEKIDKSPGR